MVSPRLLVAVGVDFEARGLRRRLTWRHAASGVARPGICVVGVAATRLDRLDAAIGETAGRGGVTLLVTGLAGGCAPEARPGHLIVGHPVESAWASAPSDRAVEPDPELVRRAVALLGRLGLPHHVGRLWTVPEVVGTPEAKRALWRDRGVLAVDMESAPVLAWAAAAGVPALVVRGIADGPADVLETAVASLTGPDGTLRVRGLGALAREPRTVAGALRIWRRSRLALDRLATFAGAFARLLCAR